MVSDPVDVEEGMPRPSSDSVQITVRIPPAWQADADEVARLMSRPGFEASRTDAIRAAIARGLEELRKEFGVASPPARAAKAPTKKGAKRP